MGVNRDLYTGDPIFDLLLAESDLSEAEEAFGSMSSVSQGAPSWPAYLVANVSVVALAAPCVWVLSQIPTDGDSAWAFVFVAVVAFGGFGLFMIWTWVLVELMDKMEDRQAAKWERRQGAWKDLQFVKHRKREAQAAIDMAVGP